VGSSSRSDGFDLQHESAIISHRCILAFVLSKEATPGSSFECGTGPNNRERIVLEILCSCPNQYGLSFVSLVIYRLAASVNLYLSLGVTCLDHVW
jgi:hypothetical protein